MIPLSESIPEAAIQLGEIKIGDTGFSTNCTWEVVIEKAKEEARKAGGNAIKITEHRPPSVMGSSCHRIKAAILKLEDPDNYQNQITEPISDDAFATLNVYRYSGAGALVNYDLHLGDSTICRVKNKFKTSIQITKEGMNTIWAKTESKAEIPIDIEMGRTYYIRCGIKIGFFVGQPSLELVDYSTGKNEFESFNP
ncbi:MAG: hypothetical protein PQJ28_03120 [Spirochaetales bacterium]|nr:hypothetical protein [Spirochaetales bacterium]